MVTGSISGKCPGKCPCSISGKCPGSISVLGRDGLPDEASPDSSGALLETAAVPVQVGSTEELGCSREGTFLVYSRVKVIGGLLDRNRDTKQSHLQQSKTLSLAHQDQKMDVDVFLVLRVCLTQL